jgi:hypothetical protein
VYLNLSRAKLQGLSFWGDGFGKLHKLTGLRGEPCVMCAAGQELKYNQNMINYKQLRLLSQAFYKDAWPIVVCPACSHSVLGAAVHKLTTS